MNTVMTVLLPLAQQGPDPADVKPGWLAFSIVLLMGAAVVLLAFSLRKQLKKADRFDYDKGAPKPPGNGAGSGEGAAPKAD